MPIAYDGSVWDTVRHVVLSPAGRVVRDQPIPVAHGPCKRFYNPRRRHSTIGYLSPPLGISALWIRAEQSVSLALVPTRPAAAQIGALRPEIADVARVLVEPPYLVLYRVLPEAVQIVGVLHGAWHLDSVLFDERLA